MSSFYSLWKNDPDLPIEVLVNLSLLREGHRTIIQIDTTYYDDPRTTHKIRHVVNSCTDWVTRCDDAGNIAVYMKHNTVERKLTAVGKAGFADLLDPVFYSIKGPWPSIFDKKRVVQVSILVTDPRWGRTGALLVQMSTVRISNGLPRVYRHFLKLSKWIEGIDPSLQTSFMCHTKPGSWKTSPELVPATFRQLQHLK